MDNRKKQAHDGLSSQIISFGELLGGEDYYAIPYLQRPFEWGEQEVGDMVGDLLAAFEARYANYFLGHIVGVRNESGGARELVDGQQRLTTFTITLSYLMWRFEGAYPQLSDELQNCVIGPEGPRLRLRARDADFLREHVQSANAIGALLTGETETRTDAQALIVQAARVVQSKLDRLALAPLAEFARFVMDQALVDFISAPDRTGAAMLYRGMNLRGRMLSTADLIKLEAIENSGLAPEQREEAARVWEAEEDALGREDFEFLLQILPVLVSRQSPTRPGDLAEWRELTFKNMAPDNLLLGALPEYGSILRELLAGEISSDVKNRHEAEALADVNKRLKGLLFLQDRLWIAPAIGAVAANRSRPIYLSKLFTGLDRLSYACFLDAVRHEDRPKRFANALRFSDEERMDVNLTDAEIRLMRERLERPFQRHGWRRRAIAVRANAACHNGYSVDAKADVTVEHILPATFNSAWERDGWAAREAQACANLLGNFALLSTVENRNASGKSFRDKLKIYFPERWQETAHPLTKDIRVYTEWTPTVVRDRTRRLVNQLFKDWEISEAG